MKTRWILLLSLMLTVLLAGCAAAPPAAPTVTPAVTQATPTRTPAVKPDFEYALIDMDFGTGSKCVLEIQLQDRISAEEIEQFAYYLSENEAKDCAPLFIFYYLPGQETVYENAWAYSHFNPDLQVKISEP